jgi:hypothetical protein
MTGWWRRWRHRRAQAAAEKRLWAAYHRMLSLSLDTEAYEQAAADFDVLLVVRDRLEATRP